MPAGFTFLELVCVVAVLLILLAVALPRFQGTFQRLQTEQLAFEMAQLFRYAQAEAVMRRQTIACTFYPETSTFRLSAEVGDQRLPLEERLGKIGPLPARVHTEIRHGEEASDGVRFFPNGGSEAAVVVLRDESGNVYRITIDEATGHAAVLSGVAAH